MVSTQAQAKFSKSSDEYNILDNMLYFRLMRRLERGTLSKSISNFCIDTAYRAVTAAVMFPFALVYEVLKGIQKSKVGNHFYNFCFYAGVFGIFFTIGIAIAKIISFIEGALASLDALIGSSNTMFALLLVFDIVAVSTGYLLGVKPSISKSDDTDTIEDDAEVSESVVVADMESPTGTKIRVSTRCA